MYFSATEMTVLNSCSESYPFQARKKFRKEFIITNPDRSVWGQHIYCTLINHLCSVAS